MPDPQVICTFFSSAPNNCGGKEEKMLGSQSAGQTEMTGPANGVPAVRSCELQSLLFHMDLCCTLTALRDDGSGSSALQPFLPRLERTCREFWIFSKHRSTAEKH